MTTVEAIRYPLLALASEDDAALSSLMPPGVEVMHVRRHGQGVVFEAGGREQPPERAQGWIAGWAWAGAQGQQTLQLARRELARLGLADDAELDLSAVPAAERASLLLAWWSQRLTAALSVLAQRHALLTREASRLRSAHDETLSRFERIETHLLGNLSAGRTRLYSLEPAALGTLALEATNVVTQRLAGGSIGLSDVAIHVASAPHEPGAGQLEVTLETAEDELVAASWQVGGERLREGGWVRLSLTRSLGVDARTARLRLRWAGPGTLALSMSVRHPDPRWCAQGDTGALHATLALQVWVGVAGATLPVAAGSVAGGSEPPRSWVLGECALSRARSTGATAAVVEWISEVGGLLVHPVAGEPSAARLDNACPAGTRVLQARVRTICDQDVRVDYALAVDAASGSPNRSPRLPALDTLYTSPWVEVGPHDMADIRLQLPEPARRDSDIYLLTRWPDRAGTTRSEVLSIFTEVRAEQ